MNVGELIDILRSQQRYREVVLHQYNGTKGESEFMSLELSCNPQANTSNLFVLIDGHAKKEPKRPIKK